MQRLASGLFAAILLTACGESVASDVPAATHDLERPGHIVGFVSEDGLDVVSIAGAADIEQGRPITPDTVFHIASLSKQITAAALAHAILEGHVSLDDPVSKHVPETAKYGDALTVAHLIYMTSGLTEYTAVPRKGGQPWVTFHYFTVDDALKASLSVDALKFQPGTSWDYSNTNYMLIAKIVEAAYGRAFADTVEDKLFAPLGMKASLIHDDVTQIVPDRANAYIARSADTLRALRDGAAIQARDGEGLVQIRRNAPHYGGSGVMTSMADWALWLEEMLTRKTFGQDFWALMERTQSFDHDKTNDAFGLVHGRIGERDTLWYAGGDIDASSYMIAVPSERVAIACFANDPSDPCQDRVTDALKEHFGTR
ncbi:MAG: serine hydrolase domain-containing protein [Pseudomonadota bacterium]